MRLIQIIKDQKINILFGIVLAVFLIFLLPDYFPKYRIELIDKINKGINQYYYHDLNHDGKSESVHLQYEDNNTQLPSLSVRTYSKSYYSAYTVYHKLLNRTWAQRARAMFADTDINGIDEIFFFSLGHDSLFLEQNFFPSDQINSKYIGRISLKNGVEDFDIFNVPPTDLNNDGYKELLFIVSDAWGAKLRKLFAYDVHNDNLMKCSEMYVNLRGPIEIYKDSVEDETYILINTYASRNYKDTLNYCTLNDSGCYLMLFNSKLELAFEPIKFPGYSNGTASYFLKDNYPPKILSRYGYWLDTLRRCKMIITDIQGNILRELDLPGDYKRSYVYNIRYRGKDHIYAVSDYINILEYDESFNLVRSFENPVNAGPFIIDDLDFDGELEIILRNRNDEKLYISRADFSHPVEIPFPYDDNFVHYTIKKNGENDPTIAFDTSKHLLKYHYYRNPYYELKYLFYLLLFSASYLIFYYFFKARNEIFLRREKEIAKLQYSSLKNQIDPHFTLNVLNSISGMYGNQRQEEADKYMVRFSRLIQQSLMNSDKISVSLKEELEFTRNFIEVQKNRYGNCFDYSIEVDEDVNLEIEIPRMLIHTFVENAIKHGLLPKKESGFLSIKASKKGKSVHIVIEDNGIGRKQSQAQKTKGTGKGLAIVNNILYLYKKLSGKRIKYRVVDLDVIGQSGTRVEIDVPA